MSLMLKKHMKLVQLHFCILGATLITVQLTDCLASTYRKPNILIRSKKLLRCVFSSREQVWDLWIVCITANMHFQNFLNNSSCFWLLKLVCVILFHQSYTKISLIMLHSICLRASSLQDFFSIQIITCITNQSFWAF